MVWTVNLYFHSRNTNSLSGVQSNPGRDLSVNTNLTNINTVHECVSSSEYPHLNSTDITSTQRADKLIKIKGN